MIKQDYLWGLYNFGDLLKYQSRDKSEQELRAQTARQGRNRVQDRISTAPENEHKPTRFGCFIGCLFYSSLVIGVPYGVIAPFALTHITKIGSPLFTWPPLQTYGEHAGITAMI